MIGTCTCTLAYIIHANMIARLSSCLRSRIVAPNVAAAWLRFGVIAAHKTGPPLRRAL